MFHKLNSANQPQIIHSYFHTPLKAQIKQKKMKIKYPEINTVLHILILMVSTFDNFAYGSIQTSNTYNRSHTNMGLTSSTLIKSRTDTKSCSECAVHCSKIATCLSLDCSSSPKQDGTVQCDLHNVKSSQVMVSKQGFDHYHLVDSLETDVATTTITETTVPTTTVTTTTVAATTIPAPAPCTEPTLSSSSPLTCSGSKIYIHAAIKVNGGGCLLFTGNGKYYKCNTITDVLVQQGKQCSGPVNIAGDSNLDPGNIWPGGAPDAAAAKMDSSQAYSKYYLFKGDTRYCYKHGSSSAPWLKPCTTKTEKIANKYSGGMPTTPLGAAWTPFDYSWLATFYEGNRIYSVTSGTSSESVVAEATEVRSSEKWSNIPCDITAALTGLNSPHMIFFKGNRYYEYNANTKVLKYVGEMCH